MKINPIIVILLSVLIFTAIGLAIYLELRPFNPQFIVSNPV